MSQWKIIIEDLAQIDLWETYIWYEKEKAGLGEEFIDAFEETIERIERNPLHASMYDETYRSTAFKRFPYGIIYLINEAKVEVYIIAISHQHRDRSWFKNRN